MTDSSRPSRVFPALLVILTALWIVGAVASAAPETPAQRPEPAPSERGSTYGPPYRWVTSIDVGTTDGQEPTGAARAGDDTSDTFEVSPDDLVTLARVASKAKLSRDAMRDRNEMITEAVVDDGVDPGVVARAAGLDPGEIAAIVFEQESNPSAFAQMRRTGRSRQAS